MQIDFNIVQILNSRLCHDLIGPAGSLQFSMSIINDSNSAEAQEAISMAAESTESLVNRLSFFRVAYGATNIGDDEVAFYKGKELICALLKEKEIELSWEKDVDKMIINYVSNKNIKLIMNIFFVMFAATQKSAVISVYAKPMKDSLGIAISLASDNVRMSNDNISALKLGIDKSKVDPRNVHCYVAGLLAEDNNTSIEINNDLINEIRIAFTISKK